MSCVQNKSQVTKVTLKKMILQFLKFFKIIMYFYNKLLFNNVIIYDIYNSRWFESNRIWAAGLIVGEVSTRACHWRAKRSLGAWLEARGVPGLCDVDTRALTFRLREGVTLGRIIQGVPPFGPQRPIADPNMRNLVAEVSVKVSIICLNFWNIYSFAEQNLLTCYADLILYDITKTNKTGLIKYLTIE